MRYTACRFIKQELSLCIFFLEFFRVTVFLSKCFEKFLKDYITKRLHQRLGKHLKIRHLHILYRRKGLKKVEKAQGRCSCRNPASITYDFKSMPWHLSSTLWHYQSQTPQRTFSEICSEFFFGTAISQNSCYIYNYYICLVSQIIIVVVGQCMAY